MSASFTDPPAEQRAAERAVDRAASLDDYLGGLVDGDGGPPHALDDDAAEGMAGLVDTMLLLRQSAAADGAVPVALPAPAPRSIGRHVILRLAGEGGFATVWEGFDTLLRRRVAVKVRRPESLLSETTRRRFVREAEIAARLVHPHVVTIFEVGEDQGREFIAAEFCSGGSLAAWLERHPGPLPPRDAARLVRALAGAVAAAHDAGVIHRDIKPANVLLAPVPPGTEPLLREPPAADGPGLTAKLGDFGLGTVHEEHDGGDPLTQLTRTGASIGTPAWMAPEQIDRSFGAVGPSTDVHALGLLLDRLLTGRAPRRGGTTAEIYRQVLLDEAGSADRAAAGVPADLAAVCRKCLARRPIDRYASAESLAADLDRWLDGRPTVARPLSPAARLARQVRRKPVFAALAATAAAASLVAAWAGNARLRDARQVAERDTEIRTQRGVAELRRGFESLRAGNVAEALAHLETTRSLDPGLAGSFAGRWLLRRTHGERSLLMEPDTAAAAADRPRDLYAIAISPDGATAAVAAADGTVRLLRGLERAPSIESVSAHDEVNAVAFSADGERLVTAGEDGRLRWWLVTPAGLVAAGAADPAAGPLYAAAFAPDGRAIACGGGDRRVLLVRLDEPDRAIELFRFAEPPGKSPDVESLVFTDAETIAASCGDQIALIDAGSGGLVREFERPFAGHRNTVLGSLTLSPDGDRLLACGTDGKAHLWDIATGTMAVSLPMHPAWVQGCCFVGDGNRVATACRDGGIRVFDARDGTALTRLVGHVGRVWAVAFEPAGTLLSCGADGTVRRWDPRDDFEIGSLREVALDGPGITYVAEIGRSSSGRGQGDLITIDTAGVLRRIDVPQGSARVLSPPENEQAFDLALDGAGRRVVASWWGSQRLRVLDLDAGTAGRVADTGTEPVGWMPIDLPSDFDPAYARPCWVPGGGMVVSTRSGSVCMLSPDLARATVIDGPLGEPVHGLVATPSGPPRVAAFGKVAAILSLPVDASRAPAGALVLPVDEQTTAVGWSPDGTQVACGTATGRVAIFEAATGAQRGQLAPRERPIVGVAYLADGRILVTADADGVRICDATTLSTLDEIRPGWTLRTMRLAADGARLLLAGDGPATATARLAIVELDRP